MGFIARVPKFIGKCDYQLINYSNFNDQIEIQIKGESRYCAIQDVQIFTTGSQAYLITADSTIGLIVHQFKMKSGTSVLEFLKNSKNLDNLSNLVYLQFVRVIKFDGNIFQIKTGFWTSTREVLVKSYPGQIMYVVNLIDLQHPYITRKFGYLGNVHNAAVTGSQFSTYNGNWVINQSKTPQGNSYTIDFFNIQASSKMMPYYAIENNMGLRWVEFLDYYQNYIIVKTDSQIKIGRVRQNWIIISGQGVSPDTQIRFHYNFYSWNNSISSPNITVTFLNKLSQNTYFNQDKSPLNLLAGDLVKVDQDLLIHGPNVQLAGTQSPLLEIQYKSFLQSQQFKLNNYPAQCSKYITFPLRSFDQIISNGKCTFCVFKNSHQIALQITNSALSFELSYIIQNPFFKTTGFFYIEQLQKIFILSQYTSEPKMYKLVLFNIQGDLNYQDHIHGEKNLRDNKFLYYDVPSKTMILVEQSSLECYIFAVDLNSFDSIENTPHVTIKTRSPIEEIYFVNSDLIYIMLPQQNKIQPYKLLQYGGVMTKNERREIKIEFDCSAYDSNNRILLLFKQPNLIQKVSIYYQAYPYFQYEIPVYHGLVFLQKSVFLMKETILFIMLKDTDDSLIYSVYDCSKVAHSSLLYSNYLFNQENEKVKASFIEQSSQFSIYAYQSVSQSKELLQVLEVETDDLAFKLEFLAYLYIIYDGKEKGIHSPSNTTITIYPKSDTLSNQPRDVYYLGEKVQNFTYFETVHHSGLIITRLHHHQNRMYRFGGDFSLSPDELFSGSLMHYQLICRTDQCDPSVLKNAITLKQPYTVTNITLASYPTAQVVDFFLFEEYLVLVDSFDLVSVFDSTQFSSIPILQINLALYGISNVQKADLFSDTPYSNMKQYFCLITGISIWSGIVSTFFFQVNPHFSSSTNIITNIYEFPIVYEEYDYSEVWDRLVLRKESKLRKSNQLIVFELKYQQLTGTHFFQLTGYINAVQTRIAPFFATRCEVHQDLPILFVGLQNIGLAGFNLVSLEPIFVFNLVEYLNERVQTYSLNNFEVYISGIQILSQFNLNLLLRNLGLLPLILYYPEQIDLSTSDFQILVDESEEQFFQGWKTTSLKNKNILNWIKFTVLPFYVQQSQLYNNTELVKSRKFCSIWLMREATSFNWSVVVFDYFLGLQSQQYMKIPLGSFKNCRKLLRNSNHQNKYPRTFFDQEYIFFVTAQLGKSMTVDYEALEALNIPSQFQISILASNQYSNLTLDLELYTLEDSPLLLYQMIALLIALLFCGLILVVFKAGSLLARKKHSEEQDLELQKYDNYLIYKSVREREKLIEEIKKSQIGSIELKDFRESDSTFVVKLKSTKNSLSSRES